jgi:site-specific recombinase XerD
MIWTDLFKLSRYKHATMNHFPSFKITIRKNELSEKGLSNVKIRVCYDKKTRYIASEYYVAPEYFINELILPSPDRTKDEADRANNRLQIEIGILAGKVEKIRDKIHTMDMASLMTILRDKRREYELLALIDERIARYKKSGNVNYLDTYKRTKGIVKSFGGSVIPLRSVTPAWLGRLQIQMSLYGLRPNSMGIHMRNIRTCYNQAITMGLIDIGSYPFRKYHIPREQTRKRNLSAEEIAKIYSQDIPNPLMAWSRDMFMLSFFLIGINMKDLMQVKRIEEDRIYYIRSKGKKQYSIKVYPESMQIIARYPGKKYLLNTLDNYADYRSATKRINKKLKDVAELCKIDKKISTYFARHSWSVIGRNIGIPIDSISEGLGHQDPKYKVTLIYLDEDQGLIDQANRLIIDHIIKIPLSE